MKRCHSLIILGALVAFGITAGLILLRPATSGRSNDHPVPQAAETSPGLPNGTPATRSDKQIRPELLEALGAGVQSPWNRRLDLLRALPSDLTAAEIDALLTALTEPCPLTCTPAVHSTYLHEIACILQPRNAIRGRFVKVLASLVRDPARDQSTRDYAIQHLRQAWGRSSDDPALRTAVVAMFREFVGLDAIVSTPALLSLHLLGSPSEDVVTNQMQSGTGATAPNGGRPGNSRPAFGLPDSELVPLLKRVFAATASSDNIPARLTAVRIAGERRMAAFREPLLAALKDPSEHAMVRMAAANALGKIADPADLESLASFDPEDGRVATALRHALQTRAGR